MKTITILALTAFALNSNAQDRASFGTFARVANVVNDGAHSIAVVTGLTLQSSDFNHYFELGSFRNLTFKTQGVYGFYARTLRVSPITNSTNLVVEAVGEIGSVLAVDYSYVMGGGAITLVKKVNSRINVTIPILVGLTLDNSSNTGYTLRGIVNVAISL